MSCSAAPKPMHRHIKSKVKTFFEFRLLSCKSQEWNKAIAFVKPIHTVDHSWDNVEKRWYPLKSRTRSAKWSVCIQSKDIICYESTTLQKTSEQKNKNKNVQNWIQYAARNPSASQTKISNKFIKEAQNEQQNKN